MPALIQQHNAVSLGQGFPNFPAEAFVKAGAVSAVQQDLNQYSRSQGHPRLTAILAEMYAPLLDHAVDANAEVVVTVGASEAIFATMQAFVNPGDEVLLIEPFYDSYATTVQMAGGTPTYVPLRASPDATSSADWTLDLAELEAAITPRTRLLVFNNPHNPTGKVFTRTELQNLAAVVQRHNLLVLSDEVYERLLYPGAPEFTRLASLPGMWERTLTVGSAGKTFSVTGWKVGWAIGPASLCHLLWMARQYVSFCAATPLCEAVAEALEQTTSSNYFAGMQDMFLSKREQLLRALDGAGLPGVKPDGGYFVVSNTRQLQAAIGDAALDQLDTRRDWAVVKWLLANVQVAGIPLSPFYGTLHGDLAGDWIRWAFCKTRDDLAVAGERLARVSERLA